MATPSNTVAPARGDTHQRGQGLYLTVICLVAALGGWLFGFDTAVLSGTIGFMQAEFSLTPTMVGLGRQFHPGRLRAGRDVRRRSLRPFWRPESVAAGGDSFHEIGDRLRIIPRDRQIDPFPHHRRNGHRCGFNAFTAVHRRDVPAPAARATGIAAAAGHYLRYSGGILYQRPGIAYGSLRCRQGVGCSPWARSPLAFFCSACSPCRKVRAGCSSRDG